MQASWESVPKYIQEIKEHFKRCYREDYMKTDRILLVGSKCDKQNERCVQYLEARVTSDFATCSTWMYSIILCVGLIDFPISDGGRGVPSSSC